MKRLPIAALLSLLTVPVYGAGGILTKTCNTTLQNADLCPASWDGQNVTLIVLVVKGHPSDAGSQAEWARNAYSIGYSTTRQCFENRIYNTLGILEYAGVLENDCTSVQLGLQVPNPQSRSEYAKIQLYSEFASRLRAEDRNRKQIDAINNITPPDPVDIGGEVQP